MTQNDPTPPKQPSLLDRIYTNNQKVIDLAIKGLLGALMGWILVKLHYNGETGDFTKDIVAKSAQEQKDQIKVQTGAPNSATAFEALKTAASQPVIQPEAK